MAGSHHQRLRWSRVQASHVHERTGLGGQWPVHTTSGSGDLGFKRGKERKEEVKGISYKSSPESSPVLESKGSSRIQGRQRHKPTAIRTVQAQHKEKTKRIRWERPRNCRLNGKTESNRREERDGVLTFGQRWTTAMEELVGVGEELAGVGEDDGVDVGFTWLSTSRRRARRGKLQGGVHLHRKCTVSPEKLAGSSPEFSRCKSLARVCER
jgi:hypothetical protein